MVLLSFLCRNCNFKTISFIRLYKHYEIIHNSIPCLIDRHCSQKFNNKRAFLRHARLKHEHDYNYFKGDTKSNMCPSDHLNNDSLIKWANENSSNPTIRLLNIDDSCNDDNLQLEQEEDIDESKDFHEYTLKVAQKLNYEHKLSLAGINFVLKQMSLISEKSYNLGLNGKDNFVSNIAEKLSSSYKRNQELNAHPNFVAPESINLQSDDFNESQEIQYVPIIKTVQNMINGSKDIQKSLSTTVVCNDTDAYKDFCDGSFCKNNPLLSDSSSIKISLYIDEFGVANPLRCRKKRLKMTGVYMRLLNMNVIDRSQLHNIKLVMIYPSILSEKFEYYQIFERLIQDLKLIETSGIYIKSLDKILKGSVCYVSADNLGAQTLGGFYESSAKKFCRKCLCNKSDRNKIDISNVTSRTKSSYDAQIKNIEEDPSLAPVYGLKQSCCLNELKFFHAIEGFPADPHHDLLEGIIPDLLSALCKYLNDKDYLSRGDLLTGIRTFAYAGSDKTDKPTDLKLTSDYKFSLSASQIFCLVHIFPFVIAHNVPQHKQNDLYKTSLWCTFITLRRILDLVFAFEISRDQLEELQSLLNIFASQFLDNVSNPYKPKFHYLLHYCNEIRCFGPIVNCGTMRFESKHLFFKEFCQRAKNRKNLTMSLAHNHQGYILYKEEFENSQKDTNFKACKLIKLNFSDEMKLKQSFMRYYSIATENKILVSKTIQHGNLTLHQGDCIPIKSRFDNTIELFAYIVCFVFVEDQVKMVAKEFSVEYFDKNLHAYKVNLPSDYNNPLTDNAKLFSINLKMVKTFQTVPLYYVMGDWYITLKRTLSVDINSDVAI